MDSRHLPPGAEPARPAQEAGSESRAAEASPAPLGEKRQ